VDGGVYGQFVTSGNPPPARTTPSPQSSRVVERNFVGEIRTSAVGFWRNLVGIPDAR
jgi:hypothetical protein